MDWDEDYDDSDGGYSDFRYSSSDYEEEAPMEQKDDNEYHHPGRQQYHYSSLRECDS